MNDSMTDPTEAPSQPLLRPLAPEARIAAPDILRGFAVLGVLLINVELFGLPLQAFSQDPRVAGGAGDLNVMVWAAGRLLCHGPPLALAAMLFGAGLMLLAERATSPAARAQLADLHHRRLVWLLLFGLAHAYLALALGDRLFAFAIAGLVLYPFRKLSPRALVLIGLLVLAVRVVDPTWTYVEETRQKAEASSAAAAAAAGEDLTAEQKEAQATWSATLERRKPDAEAIEQDIATYRSGYLAILKKTDSLVPHFQALTLYEQGFWEVAGMMFLGMGLFRLGVLTGRRSARFYLHLAGVGLAVGLAVNGPLICQVIAHDFDLLWRDWAAAYYPLGLLATSLGHLGVVMLLAKARRLRRPLEPVAAVGRMALSNYVGQTVLAVLVFDGFGLGLFAVLERFQLIYLVLGIWTLQLIASPLWLRRFRFGPGEWLWRSLAYWQRQPMRMAPAREVDR